MAEENDEQVFDEETLNAIYEDMLKKSTIGMIKEVVVEQLYVDL